MNTVKCDYCHHDAQLVKGFGIYPNRPDLWDKWFWLCSYCDAWCGCHPVNNSKRHKSDGTVPLGRLANAELRKAKQKAHLALDPLWKSGIMTRTEAYKKVAEAIGVSMANMHIGMLDVDGCKAVVAACNRFKSDVSATNEGHPLRRMEELREHLTTCQQELSEARAENARLREIIEKCIVPLKLDALLDTKGPRLSPILEQALMSAGWAHDSMPWEFVERLRDSAIRFYEERK